MVIFLSKLKKETLLPKLPHPNHCAAPALVVQLDACPAGDQEIAGSTPVGNILSWRFDHEIFLWSLLSSAHSI